MNAAFDPGFDAEEMPAPDSPQRFHDFADYERARCVQQGYGMRTIYRDPVGVDEP